MEMTPCRSRCTPCRTGPPGIAVVRRPPGRRHVGKADSASAYIELSAPEKLDETLRFRGQEPRRRSVNTSIALMPRGIACATERQLGIPATTRKAPTEVGSKRGAQSGRLRFVSTTQERRASKIAVACSGPLQAGLARKMSIQGNAHRFPASEASNSTPKDSCLTSRKPARSQLCGVGLHHHCFRSHACPHRCMTSK
jgi:hypothetical protein